MNECKLNSQVSSNWQNHKTDIKTKECKLRPVLWMKAKDQMDNGKFTMYSVQTKASNQIKQWQTSKGKNKLVNHNNGGGMNSQKRAGNQELKREKAP